MDGFHHPTTAECAAVIQCAESWACYSYWLHVFVFVFQWWQNLGLLIDDFAQTKLNIFNLQIIGQAVSTWGLLLCSAVTWAFHLQWWHMTSHVPAVPDSSCKALWSIARNSGLPLRNFMDEKHRSAMVIEHVTFYRKWKIPCLCHFITYHWTIPMLTIWQIT